VIFSLYILNILHTYYFFGFFVFLFFNLFTEKMFFTILGMSQLMFIVGAALQSGTGAAIISAMYVLKKA
jgi:hypothetical protein